MSIEKIILKKLKNLKINVDNSCIVCYYNRVADRHATDTRKCRNWQTSKTKDLVINAIVWVQVPSSAYLKGFIQTDESFLFYVEAFLVPIPKLRFKFLIKTCCICTTLMIRYMHTNPICFIAI